MAKKLPDTPALPKQTGLGSTQAIAAYLLVMVRVLTNILTQISYRINRVLSVDGTDGMTGPLVVKIFTVATVPTAADWTQGIIFVSDETGGATLAFSDGTNWRRVQDRAIVS